MYTISSTWTEFLQQFFPIFTAPAADIFFRLTTGWILCTTRRTVTGIIPFADPLGLRAHDAYHRFFPDARWTMSRLWRLFTLIVVRTLCPQGMVTLALDDTLFHHRGRKVNGAGWWRDAVRSTQKNIVYAWGLNLVVLTVQIQPPWGGEPLGLPINMRLHRKNGPTLVELAIHMIDEVHQWLPERLFRVVADGFYATLAGKVPSTAAVISRIKRNANLYDLPTRRKTKKRGRPRTKGKKLAKLEKMAAHIQNWQMVKFRQRSKIVTRMVYTRVVLWYTVSRKPILLVISRDPNGKEKDDFFFTTDLTMTAVEVLECYNDRWAIEDTFKNTKQLLDGQQPQTFKDKGPERAAAMSFWLYSTVWLWYLKNKNTRGKLPKLPWYRKKKNPSNADALAGLRQQIWRERINCMFDSHIDFEKIPKIIVNALAYAA